MPVRRANLEASANWKSLTLLIARSILLAIAGVSVVTAILSGRYEFAASYSAFILTFHHGEIIVYFDLRELWNGDFESGWKDNGVWFWKWFLQYVKYPGEPAWRLAIPLFYVGLGCGASTLIVHHVVRRRTGQIKPIS